MVADRNLTRFGEREFPRFNNADLTKLAFWMATGSGKTLILHFNLLQFLHYNRELLDNILLLTPNADLSEQHLRELEASGIQAALFSIDQSGLEAVQPGARVRVIEVTKLVEDKKDGGVRVPVKAFAGNNLIFVDEGHKGTHGEVYRGYRDALAETGFTFEYSATFGQALDAVEKPDLTDEYAKAIVFDYSYKYFYGDGFGKDFQVINLQRDDDDNLTQTLLLANLVAFYEQTLIYEKNAIPLQPYRISRPLWLFVGHTVTGKEGSSDLIKVVRFFERFVSNPRDWSVRTLEALLKGTTSLPSQAGKPFFHDQLSHLRADWEGKRNFQPLFEDIVKRVFHSPQPAHLELCPLRGQDGEIGLRIHGSEQYFALVYIDKTADFRKLAEQEPGIVVTEDAMANSLFAEVRQDSSPVNILLGARKFVEGWDSLRVSSIGLLNIGRAEGGQIIQLFGRGVRLAGIHHCLKRSTYVPGIPEEDKILLAPLERLLIFGVRASYMESFKNYLVREGIDPEGYLEFELPLWHNDAFLKEILVIPKVPEETQFRRKKSLLLAADGRLRQVKLDLSTKLSSIRMGDTLIEEAGHTEAVTGQLNGALALLRWDHLYLSLLDYARAREYHNLAISPETPKAILTQTAPALYEITAPKTIFSPTTTADWQRLQAAALTILQKYTDTFYRSRQKRFETEHMERDRVRKDHPNMREPYRVQVPRSNARLAQAIKDLCAGGPRRIWHEVEDLKNIYFDRHIYQPLLVQKGNEELGINPAPLEESEQQFVEKLRAHWHALPEPQKNKRKLFLLRNLSRGHGIGFYEFEGFFPDFILWLVEGTAQHVIFVEPHGMQHEAAISQKKRLFEDIREYTKAIVESDKKRKITFDSWVVSKTAFVALRKNFTDDGRTPWTLDQFHAAHIVFAQETDYMQRIVGP